METPKIFESEYRFCLILWENEPVNSTRLVELCKQQLGWSKATTYTVIRRLAERGVVKNDNAVVTSLVSKEQAQASRLDEMVEQTFEGSLPAFIAAFSRSQKLTRDEVAQLKELIDNYKED
ncbi:MAG: BlaI/MecI/CopY family transcriptional regulator [Firmicutes bacterium]|nr:BlaI/MecI/CopY family transcriptional regulator [Bacillota bacterium]